jgi:hypothetical protein
MSDTQRTIARARLLRRTGKTYDEVRATLGVSVSDDRLKAWLRGIPRPPETRRSRARVEQRRKARRLRTGGATYDEIAAALGVSKASLSLWLRELPVPDRVQRRRTEHLERLRGRGAASMRRSAGDRMRYRQAAARQTLSSLTQRELFVVGLALYWSEGTKDKPWRRYGRVRFINSDPGVMAVFLAWLRLVGVATDECVFWLSIHESADPGIHERWWQERLGLPPSLFRRPVLKRHNPRTVRRNVDEGYHGCLVVQVRRSVTLYDAIAGWWDGLVDAASDNVRCHERVTSPSCHPGSSKGRTASFGVAYGGSNPSPGAETPASNPWLPPRWWDSVGSSVPPFVDLAEPS